MTVQDFINSSLRLLNAIVAGETPSTAESDDAFAALNQILLNWNNQRWIVPGSKHGSFALSADNISYTMGVGGAFATTTRPVRITAASFRNGAFAAGADLVPPDVFARRVNNPLGATVALPSLATADNARPLINVRVFPPPKASTIIDLDWWEPMSAFASKSSEISLPDGYEHVLRHELAVVLYPEYPVGQIILASLQATLRDAKAEIANLNSSILNGPMVAPPQ